PAARHPSGAQIKPGDRKQQSNPTLMIGRDSRKEQGCVEIVIYSLTRIRIGFIRAANRPLSWAMTARFVMCSPARWSR
ncbi:hypothetical protein, partial [Bradyrhizobium sp. C9]|uniref:hypothetical protein n=1 Tax=Bradyrhizobium sp. C9 TaxID=142585 RepID=UPI001AECA714